MTRYERLRRVAILCCAFTRNLAYYRAGWQESRAIFDLEGNIHRTINGNFLDMSVLEWCKLFGSREKHGWHNIVSDNDTFRSGLLAQLAMNEAGLDAFFEEMRAYRDKFVAHLDSEKFMHVPKMDIAKGSVIYYYNYLLRFENDGTTFEDGPSDLGIYYELSEGEGRSYYAR